MAKKFLRKAEVRLRYGNVSARTLENWVRRGRVSPPVYFAGCPFPFFEENQLNKDDAAALDPARTETLRARMTAVGKIGVEELRARRQQSTARKEATAEGHHGGRHLDAFQRAKSEKRSGT